MYHRETRSISVQDVKAFCKKHGITENVFFISAFGITLGKYNFRKDAVFTTIYHGRNDSRLSDTVGMLVKTLPVYCDFSGSTADCLNAVQQQLINSMNNDIYPFSQISHEFNIKADAMVIYQGDNFAFDNIGGEYAQEEPVQLNAAKAPFPSVFQLREISLSLRLSTEATCTTRKPSNTLQITWKPRQTES